MEKKIILANVDLDTLKTYADNELGMDEFDEWQAIIAESGWMKDSGIHAYSVLDYHHYQVLSEPIPHEDLEARADDQGYLTAYISVDLFDLIGWNIEDLNDIVSEKIVGSCMFMDISYEVVQNLSGGDIVIKVTGDASEVIADWDKTQKRISD